MLWLGSAPQRFIRNQKPRNPMTTAIVKAPEAKPKRVSALELMASRLSVDPNKLHATLKATVFKNASDEEMLALVAVSNEYQLNPLIREIYAFPAKGGGIVPVVSVDGWNKLLIRQLGFDGIEFSFEMNEDRSPYSCTATIHVKGRSHPCVITEYFSECFRNTDNWKNMPMRMLRHRALCQASRMAFGISGVTNEDEAQTYIDVASTTDAPPTPPARQIPGEPPPKIVTLPPREKKPTVNEELEAAIVSAGFTLRDLLEYGKESGTITNENDQITEFSGIEPAEAKRLLRAIKVVIEGLKAKADELPMEK